MTDNVRHLSVVKPPDASPAIARAIDAIREANERGELSGVMIVAVKRDLSSMHAYATHESDGAPPAMILGGMEMARAAFIRTDVTPVTESR